MALAKQTRAIVDRYGPWFAFTELVDMARISREMKQKPLLGEVLMSVKIPARFMTRFLCDCAGRLKALETNEFVGSGEVLPPYQRHILRAAGCFKLVTKLMLSDVSFWSFLDFARLVCALGSLSELELREVSWRRDDGRNLAAEPFAKALALRDLEIHDSSETLKYRKLFGAPQLFDSLTSLRLFGCVSVYCAVKHQEQDPENLSLDTKPHDAASAGTPFIHRRAVNMRVRPGLDSTTKWEAETRWTRECLDLLNCFLNPGASYLNAVDVVLHDCPKDILDIFREDPPPFYGLRDRGILSVKDCRDLDIWNETWGCEEVIIAPNVINQPTQ
ncbi:hypothetical protein CERSUDRAFT_100719 [Gelatoporia subvermispora B]|uniref:F-box domain-containing protein n=1 Tax=Ceriporiopsis subvermispora (strain B) TaxID=914234 RepID=M2QX20_CERS8|nr:hypothetical protein CERSUDRAFT_100719 [Gelatoporia subvermispora B]